jgi:hypothetical protein
LAGSCSGSFGAEGLDARPVIGDVEEGGKGVAGVARDYLGWRVLLCREWMRSGGAPGKKGEREERIDNPTAVMPRMLDYHMARS